MTDEPVFPPRFDVVGTPISATTYDEVINLLANPRTDRATVIAVCNVHSVMTARRDRMVAAALNEADVATPDGMPLVWALRWLYRTPQTRVYGPDIMRAALSCPGTTHFLYGSDAETIARLRHQLSMITPEPLVVGAIAPPFRDLTDSEFIYDIDDIRRSQASVVWVGLGMPKQELWMHRSRDLLPGVTLIGVGAAFDFIAGRIPQAPAWMQRAGLEWVYRLRQEPRRLWRRYLLTNPSFVVSLVVQYITGSRSARTRSGVR